MINQPGTLISRIPDQLSVELSGEIAILNLRSKLYFGLTDVGAFIWNLLEKPTAMAKLAQSVTEHFEVGAEQAAADTEAFLRDLSKAGLLEIEPHGGAAG